MKILITFLFTFLTVIGMSQQNIKLPPPQKEIGKPLMQALNLRESTREFKPDSISMQDLSNLLWAACGITKEETSRSKSRRTAPSASNSQAIKIYVTMKKGLFLYDEKNHQLIQILSKNIREDIGTQKMMHSAPLGLIYVSDFSKMKIYLAKDDHRKWFVSGTDTGFISQNVYLYCAAEGLATVVLGWIDKEALAKKMMIEPNQRIMLTQPVGYPK